MSPYKTTCILSVQLQGLTRDRPQAFKINLYNFILPNVCPHSFEHGAFEQSATSSISTFPQTTLSETGAWFSSLEQHEMTITFL